MKLLPMFGIFVSTLFLFASSVYAAERVRTMKVNGTDVEISAAAERQLAEEKGQENFVSLNFGAGLFAGFDIGGKQRVDSARVVNGIVRVEEKSDAQLGFILEAHRFFGLDSSNKFGIGPYIGVIASNENVFSAASAGVMFGFRPEGTSKSLNIGIGGIVYPSVKVLGEGIEANQPIPQNETEVRTQKITKYGIAIVASFGF